MTTDATDQMILPGDGKKVGSKQRLQLKVVSLKIREDLFERMDRAVEERIGLTRNAWILEAIQEKLKRDGLP